MAEHNDEEWPIEPEHFFEKRWPHPRLRDNRAVGRDLALVLWMDWFGLDADRIKKKSRFVRVKVSAKYRCHQCGKSWASRHGWVNFDMKEQIVDRQFGQKCKECTEPFYSRPFPFFYADRENRSNGSDVAPNYWRDIVMKAIHRYELSLVQPRRGQGGGDAQEDHEEPLQVEGGSGPHEKNLCEMCTFLRRPCWNRRRR